MEKKKIWGVVLVVILVLAAVGTGVWLALGRENKSEPVAEEVTTKTDGQRFKESYESLNGTIRESDGATYQTIEIDENNPIKYTTVAEMLDVMDNENAVIYVGGNWCPWCRNAVPVLLEVAKEFGVEKLYYVELDDDKSTFEIRDGELVKTKDGSEAYYKLLERLGDRFAPYSLKDKDGKEYPTGETRMSVPYVIGVSGGEIVAEKKGTVSLNEGQTKYDPMTSEQKKQVRDEYRKLFEAALGKKADDCDEICTD